MKQLSSAESYELGYNNAAKGYVTRELTAREILGVWPYVNDVAFANGLIDGLNGLLAMKASTFWRSGKWRTARKPHACNGLGHSYPSTCQSGGKILAGEEYFDTMELVDPPWGTLKMCKICAGRPLPD